MALNASCIHVSSAETQSIQLKNSKSSDQNILIVDKLEIESLVYTESQFPLEEFFKKLKKKKEKKKEGIVKKRTVRRVLKKSKNEIQSTESLPFSVNLVLIPLPELIPDLVPDPAIISVSDGNDKDTEISSSFVSFIPISILFREKSKKKGG